MKTRDLYIDADHLLYNVAGQKAKDSLEGEVIQQKVDMAPLKEAFNQGVKAIEDAVAVATVSKKFKVGWTYLVFSDPQGNFRYDIFPDYKKSRQGKVQSDEFYALRRWAHVHPDSIVVDGTEADDVVAYYVRKGAIGASNDKDILKGVKGRWFDTYYSRWSYSKVKKKDADRFVLLQTLAGDSTDGIKGIPRVAMKTAENLLTSNGESWDGVVKSYENAGLKLEDAILTRRLVGMDQWDPKSGVQLWLPSH